MNEPKKGMESMGTMGIKPKIVDTSPGMEGPKVGPAVVVDKAKNWPAYDVRADIK